MQTIRRTNGIEYTLTRKRVKNINLRIHQDGSVIVSANTRVPLAVIDEFVGENKEKILKAREKLSERQEFCLIPKICEDGESFYFLGKKTVISVSGGRTRLENGVLYLPTGAKGEFLKWISKQANEIFSAYVKQTFLDFKTKYNIPFPNVTIKAMKSRWGSCRKITAEISLNIFLLAAPPECIRYVVVHEFSHLLHPDHSKAFWNTVEEFVPDRKQRRDELKNYGTQI